MKDNIHHCNFVETLENLSLGPLFDNDKEEKVLDYDRIPGFLSDF